MSRAKEWFLHILAEDYKNGKINGLTYDAMKANVDRYLDVPEDWEGEETKDVS